MNKPSRCCTSLVHNSRLGSAVNKHNRDECCCIKESCLITWTLNWNTHYESQCKYFDILRHIITGENEIFFIDL